MPITVIATEGVLPEGSLPGVFADLTRSFLALHGLAGNAFIEPNVIGEASIVPKGRTFAGGKRDDLVIVELKVPSFALASPEQKSGWVKEATDIVVKASGGRHPADRVYVNMVYAVDGLWGIAGKAYTNAELGTAVQHAAQTKG